MYITPPSGVGKNYGRVSIRMHVLQFLRRTWVAWEQEGYDFRDEIEGQIVKRKNTFKQCKEPNCISLSNTRQTNKPNGKTWHDNTPKKLKKIAVTVLKHYLILDRTLPTRRMQQKCSIPRSALSIIVAEYSTSFKLFAYQPTLTTTAWIVSTVYVCSRVAKKSSSLT